LVFARYAGVYFPGVDTRDWTSGGRTLTAKNSPGTAASGYEGITAATYNGTSSYHYNSGTQGATAWPMSLETLMLCDVTTGIRAAVNLGVFASTSNVFSIWKQSTGVAQAGVQGNGGSAATAATGTMSTATWYYAANTRDSTTGDTYGYFNGTQYTNAGNINAFGTADRIAIGSGFVSSAHNSYWDGNIAVALLSDSVRSADYVATMQDNWAGTMYSAGAWTALDSCTDGSTGWVLFQTAATTSASGSLVDWTSTSNALVDDSNYTQAALDGGGDTDSEVLKLTNPDYGTTIPTGAASYTVQFRIKRVRGTGGSNEVNDLVIKLIDDTGALVGDNLAATTTDWPVTAATAVPDYTVTGVTLDGTEFTSAAGLAISATAFNAAGAVNARVLVGWMKVDWTCPGSGPFPLLLISEE